MLIALVILSGILIFQGIVRRNMNSLNVNAVNVEFNN